MNEPRTKYSGNENLAWYDNGWDVLCWPGSDRAYARVELFVGAGGSVVAESYWMEDDPKRQRHASPDEALARFLGES